MKLKNSNGITLISLIVTIIILFVIGGSIIYNTQNQILVKRINNLYTDITSISARVDAFYVNYGELPILCDYITEENGGKSEFINIMKEVSMSNNAILNQELTVNPNDNDKYYVIDLEKLDGLTLNYGYDDEYKSVRSSKTITPSNQGNEVYVINELTHQIYFPHGIVADKVLYYTYDFDNYEAKLTSPVDRSALKIGDYVNYTYDTSSYTLKKEVSGYGSDQNVIPASGILWRVMNINSDGSVDLISNKVGATANIRIRGAKGYNNGVYILNDICKTMFSNSKLKNRSIVRSINMEDIEKQYKEETINERNSYISPGGVQYGYEVSSDGKITTKTYGEGYNYYPALYEKEKGSGTSSTALRTKGILRSESYYTGPTNQTSKEAIASEGLTVTQTFYTIKLSEDSFINSNFNNLINGAFWIASRCVRCNKLTNDSGTKEGVLFGIHCMYSREIRSGYNYYSSNRNANSSDVSNIRPVIHLAPSVKINACEGKNGTENMHMIEGI